MEPKLFDLIGEPRTLSLFGKDFTISPMTLEDLAYLEEINGDLNALFAGAASSLRFFLWSALRQSNPSLTIAGLAKQIPAGKFGQPEVQRFVKTYMDMSGFGQDNAAAPKDVEGNVPAANP